MTPLPAGVLRDHHPLDAAWECVTRTGSRRTTLQVRTIDAATFALRQSSRVNPEAPIGYLVCGTARALLLDTGAVPGADRCPLRATVDALLEQWAGEKHLPNPSLVVAHTHGHYDHVKGDVQFLDRPDTVVVDTDAAAVHRFFGLSENPASTTPFDLGDRTLLVAATPGHDARSITTIDPTAGLMFAGDTAYPGRLYLDDLPAAKASLTAMVDLAEAHGIHTVLGAHVENDGRGGDHPVLTRFHDHEAPFALTVDQLRALRDHVLSVSGDGVFPGDPMTLYVGKAHRAMLMLLARGVARRLVGRG